MPPEYSAGPSASAASDRSVGRERPSAVLAAPVDPSARQSGKRCSQGLRGLEGLLRVSDRSDDDDASGSRFDDLLHISRIDATDREPGSASRRHGGCVFHKAGADRGTSRLRGRGPDRSHAEVIGFRVSYGTVDLVGRVSRQTQSHAGAEKRACRWKRQIVLAEVQDRAARGGGDVNAVVDRPQFAVAFGGFFQNVQEAELGSRFECFVAKLNDVDTTAECGVDEFGEIALAGTGIRAEVQLP